MSVSSAESAMELFSLGSSSVTVVTDLISDIGIENQVLHVIDSFSDIIL